MGALETYLAHHRSYKHSPATALPDGWRSASSPARFSRIAGAALPHPAQHSLMASKVFPHPLHNSQMGSALLLTRHNQRFIIRDGTP